MIRLYTPEDLRQVVDLFTHTVHLVGSSYYSSEETEAWAPLQPDYKTWELYFGERYTIVMESGSEITGFGCLHRDGSCIDMLFTHHAHQGEGIGTAVMDALEREALQRGAGDVFLTTSATAWKFYRKRGYDYHHSEKKTYGRVVFDCQILRKALPVFPGIRRKDRILDDARARELLEEGEYGFLAMNAVNGYGYGIPINYALSGESIYFHCAPEGFKLENIRRNNRVSFCVTGRTQALPQQFGAACESVLVFGRMACNLPEEERRKALNLLAEKYSPGCAGKSFHRTGILRLDMEHLSAKAKK